MTLHAQGALEPLTVTFPGGTTATVIVGGMPLDAHNEAAVASSLARQMIDHLEDAIDDTTSGADGDGQVAANLSSFRGALSVVGFLIDLSESFNRYAFNRASKGGAA
jgi:hypothetical protein